MARTFFALLLLALTGCANLPNPDPDAPCAKGEATYECQIERYNNVDA